MDIFITGGYGAVGRIAVNKLLVDGWDVSVLVHPSERDLIAPRQTDRLKTVVADLDSLEKKDIPEEATVVHLAAKVHTVPKSSRDVDDFFHVNRDGSIRLAKIALKRNAKTFLFVSTAGVYGDAFFDGICTENTLVRPNSPYAQSKFDAECELNSLCASKCRLIVFRPSVMFGPGDRGNFIRLFRTVKKGVVPCIDHGAARKNILYANDFANILALASKSPELFADGVYNVAYREPYTLLELIRGMERVTRRKVFKVPIHGLILKLPALLFDGIGALTGKEIGLSSRRLRVLRSDSVMDVTKLHDALASHYFCKSFEEGLSDYIISGNSPWSKEVCQS